MSDDRQLEGRALGAAFLERAKAHYSHDGVVPVEIPELADDKGAPFVVYVSPMSPEENDKLTRACTDRKTGQVDSSKFAAMAVIAKARDADGQRLFAGGNLVELMKQCDTQIIGRIAQAIFGQNDLVTALESVTGNGALPGDVDEDDLLERSSPIGNS